MRTAQHSFFASYVVPGLVAGTLACQTQPATADTVFLRYSGEGQMATDGACDTACANNINSLSQDSGLSLIGQVPFSVTLTIDDSINTVGRDWQYRQFYPDPILSATLQFGALTFQATRGATGSGGYGVENQVDLRASPYAGAQLVSLQNRAGNPGTYTLFTSSVHSGSRSDFGYEWRDFYADVVSQGVFSELLSDIDDIVTGTNFLGLASTNSVHIGIDFVNFAFQWPDYYGSTYHARSYPTLSFNGQVTGVQVLSAVPEPTSLALMLSAAITIGAVRRRHSLAAR